MLCISPVYAKGSTRVNPVWVPCNRCGYCMETRRQGWAMRLLEEYEQSKHQVYFITLTYNNENLPRTWDNKPLLIKHFPASADVPTLNVRHVQLFNKKLRKLNARYTKEQYRYYLAGEYGERYGRPHYHLIVFNLHPATLDKLGKLWNKGTIDLRPCNGKRNVFAYVAGYVVGSYTTALRLNKRPFSIMSKKPYLGHTYVERMKSYHKKNLLPYLERGKLKLALPRIFKQKIFEQWELNAMKQPAFVQSELAREREISELKLLNPDRNAETDYEQKRRYHNDRILRWSKHTDKHEYLLGNPTER